ncbi:MAG: hypothetical protein ACE5HV_10355 [Acidobacteriota bacterium]
MKTSWSGEGSQRVARRPKMVASSAFQLGFRLAAVAGVLVALLAVSAPVGAQAPAAEISLQSAVSLLQSNHNGRALTVLQQVLEKEPRNVAAQFYRGMALGRLGREEDAQHAFLVAGSLAPGLAKAHRYAAIASYQIGDYQKSWEQAILAARAGAQMNDAFRVLGRASSPPEDWRERLDAPLIYVEPPDVSGVLAVRTYGFEGRLGGRDAPTGLPGGGGGVQLMDIPFDVSSDSGGGGMASAADAGETATQRVAANQGQIMEMMREFRDALAHAAAVGLATRPQAATYRMRIEILELAGNMAGKLVGCELVPGGAGSGGGHGNMGDADVDTDVYEARLPKKLKGNLSLLDQYGLELYSTKLDMKDISSLADLHQRIVRYVDDIEAWAESNRGEPF